MTAPGFAIVADDLTGAADSGVHFSKNGYRTVVFFRGAEAEFEGLDAVALDTDSRGAEPDEARRRVFEAGSKVEEAGVVFKKVDSTLRGNLAVEIEALMRATGRERAVVAPAFPSGGRTTIGGIQFVNGTPVHETEFARDPKTPVTEAHLPTILSALGAKELEDADTMRRTVAGNRCVISDATRDEHLRSLVEAMPDASSVLWVGSAGLARALASVYSKGRGERVPLAGAGGVLVVVGSLSGVSRKQLRNLDMRGRAVPVALEVDVETTARRARTILEAGGNAALYSPSEVGKLAPGEVCGMLAEVAHGLDGLFGALILTGGDTAAAVARRLGARGVEVFGEVEDGVPFGRLVGGGACPVATKAGGFGRADTLCDTIDFLTKKKEEVL